MSILRRLLGQPDPIETTEPPVKRVAPLEGTRMSLWNSQIPSWWQENIYDRPMGTPQMVERVWVAARCQQLNAQQIASMPIRFLGPPSATEPAWLSNPDPNWFPNGIGDAIFAIVNQMYGWGFACLYVTDYYATLYPRTWTVLDSSRLTITADEGFREYRYGDDDLDSSRVIQIDRNPGLALHGTSAIRAYAQNAWGLLAASNQAMAINNGAIPAGIVKSTRKLDSEQADQIQDKWMNPRRPGAPRVLGPELDWVANSFSPADLSLLENQEWNARTLASAYGVPSVILNMALQGGLTYQNPMALMQMWWLTELRTSAKRLEDAFSNRLLPDGQVVFIDASDITSELSATSSQDDPQKQPSSAPPGPQAQQNQSQTQSAMPMSRPLSAVRGG